MDVYEIEKIVRKGGSSLAESFHQYWPATADNGAPERNTTLHLGHELIKAGFDLYAEHSFTMEGKKKILDLLALNYKEGTQIRIEAKMGSGSTAINGIYQDLKKIKSFQLIDSDFYDDVYENKFGLIIHTSWENTLIKWWENPFEAEPIKNRKALTEKEEIGRLIDHSHKEDDCLSDTYTLRHSEMERGNKMKRGDKKKWPIHGMQYLIFDLNSTKIKKLLPKN